MAADGADVFRGTLAVPCDTLRGRWGGTPSLRREKRPPSPLVVLLFLLALRSARSARSATVNNAIESRTSTNDQHQRFFTSIMCRASSHSRSCLLDFLDSRVSAKSQVSLDCMVIDFIGALRAPSRESRWA